MARSRLLPSTRVQLTFAYNLLCLPCLSLYWPDSHATVSPTRASGCDEPRNGIQVAKYFRDVFGSTELSAVAQLPAPKGPYGRCFICEDSFALTPTPYVEGSKSGPGDGRYFPHNSWRCKNILRSVSVLISRAAAKGIALVETEVLRNL